VKETQAKAVSEFIARAAGASTQLEIISMSEMKGGESKENWLLELELEGGQYNGRQKFVLRVDEQKLMPYSHNCVQEFHALEALHKAGVKVPAPLFLCEEVDVYPNPFFVMERIAGKSQGERLVAELSNTDEGNELVEEVATSLATIHKIKPPQEDLIFLETPPESPALKAIEDCYGYLDRLTADSDAFSYPVIEWGIRWCQQNLPKKSDIVLCHGDYRLNNMMVSDGHLTGIIDWEYVTWSDPHEDIANFCAKFSRFGAYDMVAGGLANLEVFSEAYQKESKREVDMDRFNWWKVMVNLRRALVCIEYGRRHQTGLYVSLDLALTTHSVAALELEVLSLIDRIERAVIVQEKEAESA